MVSENLEFTQAEYRELLSETVARLPPRGFDVIERAGFEDETFSLIRHDIDMSPSAALELARIEESMGVRATYAILLTGDFYNAFEDKTRRILLQIASLGHDIALHFDAAWHQIEDEVSLDSALQWETSMLSRLLDGYPIRSFSFHNTTPFTMECRRASYGGLWNIYGAGIQDHVAYVSDSNGYWRFKSWRQALKEQPDRLQVLTHPEWWMETSASPAEKVCRHLAIRERQTWDRYANLLLTNKRENRSPFPRALESLAAGGESDRAVLQQWLAGNQADACRKLSEMAEEAGADRAELLDSHETKGDPVRSFDRLANILERARKIER